MIGLDFIEVKNSYRPVNKQELDAYHRELDAHKYGFRKADQAFREAKILIESENGAWENECNNVLDRHPQKPADLRDIGPG